MSFRLLIAVIGLFFSLTVSVKGMADEQVVTDQDQALSVPAEGGALSLELSAMTGDNVTSAEQTSANLEQMTVTPAPVIIEITSRESLVEQLRLRDFEAAANDLLLCKDDRDDEACLRQAKFYKSWLCLASVCDGEDKSKEPAACFEGVDPNFLKILNQENASFCLMIKSPSSETRRSLLSLSDIEIKEDNLVELGAALLALKGFAGRCEDYIKNYVGVYGSQWKYKWYRALSGCRILAHESTREQEEQDFYTWFGVEQGVGNCSDIVNSALRDACNTPGVASPKPVYEK